MSTFWTNLGLTDKQNVLLGFILVIVFGLSVGGLFAGIVERKYKTKNQFFGIIGNLILVILFIIALVLVTDQMMN
jgi:phage-related holin